MRRFVVLSAVMAVGLALLASTASVTAGVDPLRGEWDLTLELSGEQTSDVRLYVAETAADPADPNAILASGCLETLDSGLTAPASLRAVQGGEGDLEVTVFSTVAVGEFGPSVVRLEGLIHLYGEGVADDTAAGIYVAGFGDGAWFGGHHDRRNPMCTDLDIGLLQFGADAYTAQDAQNPPNGGTLVESSTQIVSSGMLVESPTLGTIVAEPFTDIFSPDVDFVEEFRFLGGVEALPPIAESFTFTLLDVLGDPIPGAVATDTWNGCFQGAPGNLQGNYVFEDHLDLSWDPVAVAPGFDPATGVGFYQIESTGGFGANEILTTSHQIPWAPFDGSAPGFPDGNDFGVGLSEFTDGMHEIFAIAFAEDVGPNGVGLACQVRDEPLRVEKQGSDISVLLLP